MQAVVRKGFILCVLLGAGFVLLGWALMPAINPLGVVAVGFVLAVYGLIGYFGFPRIHPQILSLVGLFGLLAGAIFAGEILLEYVVLPKDNTNWGTIEFGGVFAVYFLSSLVTAYRYRSVRSGIVTAVANAMLSSVIWLIVVLLMFYLFRGTYRQERVFLAEGTYVDFANSEMSDFNTFVMEDFLGAGFYHLLLGPIIAAVLGMIGGITGKTLARFQHKN